MKNIKLIFTGHSGFIVETEETVLAFDITKEGADIDELNQRIENVPREKKLFVFSSHAHGDHYTPRIFTWFGGIYGGEPAEFFLGDDKEMKFSRVPDSDNIHFINGNEEAECEGVKIETLPSTDAGVAFIVTADEKTIFHAGDLVWWDWTRDGGVYDPEEARKEAEETERDFKEKMAPLKGRHIDLAMIPLDPRLGGTSDWTIEEYNRVADIDLIAPMHQWGQFTLTDDFVKSHPDMEDKIIRIQKSGETFTL